MPPTSVFDSDMTKVEHRKLKDESSAHNPSVSEEHRANKSSSSTTDRGQRDKKTRRPIDYDEGAVELWKAYVTEAESHDRALVETWKDDMESIIIFAGLYSASLTAFLVESYQNLQEDPVEQTKQFANQSVTLLVQISRQLGANAGQPAPTLSFPDPQSVSFSGPTASDVRINTYWFISLVLSLTAVLFAIIVQQWVRDYMHHVFQRYSHPLKRARIRQFLFEGATFWRMSVIVDAIPALIHISLFLFFVGLGEFLFPINHTVAIWTTAVMSLSALLYIWTMFAPIISTQSPYQSPASGIFWYIFQKFLRGRRYKDHDGNDESVSTDITEGRVQIAMDESPNRMARDAEAIHWLIDNLTEDSEFQPFVAGIAGSLNSDWGKRAWRNIFEEKQATKGVEDADDADTEHEQEYLAGLGTEDGDTDDLFALDTLNYASPNQHTWIVSTRGPRRVYRTLKGPLSHAWNAIGQSLHRRFVAYEPRDRIAIVKNLTGRIMRMLRTCTEYGILSKDDRMKRGRACIDAALQLVLSLNVDWQPYFESETICRTLIYLDGVEKSNDDRTNKSQDQDTAFAARRACMTVIVVQHMIQEHADVATKADSVVQGFDYVNPEKETGDFESLAKVAGFIDSGVEAAWDTAKAFGGELKGQSQSQDAQNKDALKKAINQSSVKFDVLDDVLHRLEWARPVNNAIADLADALHGVTAGVLEYLPGSFTSWPNHQLHQPTDVIHTHPTWFLPQLLPPLHLVERLWSSVYATQTLNVETWTSGGPKKLSELDAPELALPPLQKIMEPPHAPMQKELWRAIDISKGGMGFTIELLINAMRSTELPRTNSSRTLFIETLNAITRDWEQHNNPGTQKLLLCLLKEAIPKQHDLSQRFVDELVKLAGRFLGGSEGKWSAHMVDVLDVLRSYPQHTHAGKDFDVQGRCSASLEATLHLLTDALLSGELYRTKVARESLLESLDAILQQWGAPIEITANMKRLLVTLLLKLVSPDEKEAPLEPELQLSFLEKIAELVGKILGNKARPKAQVSKALVALRGRLSQFRRDGRPMVPSTGLRDTHFADPVSGQVSPGGRAVAEERPA
ncbi:hypothetical protein OF83DRAFT_491993 [Amylostereum chailletii]|nr:hypothetical protein OF83DRAFT_491993 [Amylostereum chailletii]